jgi:hypothetical protein
VARHIRLSLHSSNQARAPIGSATSLPEAKQATPEGGAHDANQATSEGGAPGSNQARAPIGSNGSPPTQNRQPSLCEAWRQVIVSKLEAGLTAQRIYQDLVNDHGFAGRYHSVRRFVRRLEQKQALPFRRMECAPGEEAQVDFGSGAPVVVDGRRRRTHVFRIVLNRPSSH